MNPSRPFILRPVATSLLMAAILLAGIFAYRLLPLSALPEVDYPTIQVVTFYPGASPEVMTSSVTAPLERQFGQIPGLRQMSSTSSGGASVITLQFNLDLSLDVAEQGVQAAINAASNLMPPDLPAPPVYSKVNPADAPILALGLTSKTLPLPEVQNLADTRLAQKISQVSGVGLVTLSGGQRPAVRVQANPKALAAHGLTLEDVRTAVAAATGSMAAPQGLTPNAYQSFAIDAGAFHSAASGVATADAFLDTTLTLKVQPHGSTVAPLAAATLLVFQSPATSGVLQQWDLPYANPYPSTWGGVVTVKRTFLKDYVLPGSTTTAKWGFSVQVTYPKNNLPSQPIAPLVGPVPQLKIN